MRPAKCPQVLAAAAEEERKRERELMALSGPVSGERWGQPRDCSGSTGEVTFQPGSEWQVRKWSVSWGPFSGIGWKPRATAPGGCVCVCGGGRESTPEQRKPRSVTGYRRGC